MINIAVKDFDRADADVIKGLSEIGVASVHEAQERSGLLDRALRPIYPGPHIAGSALTVLAQPGDNLMIHVAVELAKPGDILVVAVTTPNTDGMFGDLLGLSCCTRGVLGLVTDAGVRDISTLREIGFPAWSRAVSAQGAVKNTTGAVNVPIICAGQSVRPGDIIVADDDGIVCVPRLNGKEVLASAIAREEKEAGIRERLEAGESTMDVFGLREELSRKGFKYFDRLEEVDKKS